MNMLRVYCGCDISVGMFDDRECSWEGYVVANTEVEEEGLGWWDCPECGAESLAVMDHLVLPDHDRPVHGS